MPGSTYRLQLGADLTLDDAAQRVPYLASLGVTHVYLSPILRAAPGSTHGYDVVDHDEIAPELGGLPALRRLATAAHEAGLGLVLDIVPNHMAVAHARLAQPRAVVGAGARGPTRRTRTGSTWTGPRATVPSSCRCSATASARCWVATSWRWTRSRSPARARGPSCATTTTCSRSGPGTESLSLAELVERQHYRLAYWRVADEELNYRRFFDVGTLLAVRVEDPAVFDATHALVLSLLADGTIDGLRIDHPDGLADPAGYLARLREASGGAWVVVEKILEGDRDAARRLGDRRHHRLRGAVADPADLRRPRRRRGARCRHAPADGRHLGRVPGDGRAGQAGDRRRSRCTRRCTG